ncbi:MAG: hypothetical protein EZS28_007727 [Streblomastix strix]|uniref:Uncharacterized protein n=1 Tax=Streblomastix strix TaxID=222440 RepID=A0A5J4WRP5_9EUKA|nr:MAG: hypothetical protein EZS28_007727 [Streblomastix strix]
MSRFKRTEDPTEALYRHSIEEIKEIQAFREARPWLIGSYKPITMDFNVAPDVYDQNFRRQLSSDRVTVEDSLHQLSSFRNATMKGQAGNQFLNAGGNLDSKVKFILPMDRKINDKERDFRDKERDIRQQDKDKERQTWEKLRKDRERDKNRQEQEREWDKQRKEIERQRQRDREQEEKDKERSEREWQKEKEERIKEMEQSQRDREQDKEMDNEYDELDIEYISGPEGKKYKALPQIIPENVPPHLEKRGIAQPGELRWQEEPLMKQIEQLALPLRRGEGPLQIKSPFFPAESISIDTPYPYSIRAASYGLTKGSRRFWNKHNKQLTELEPLLATPTYIKISVPTTTLLHRYHLIHPLPPCSHSAGLQSDLDATNASKYRNPIFKLYRT